VTDIYLYADETGNLDYDAASKDGASLYFGFGTALFDRDHGEELWQGFQLRVGLEARELNLPRGFHAKDDSRETRNQMFDLIARQTPRVDTTFLYKAAAYEHVKSRGQMYLYQMAWYLHLKEIALQVSEENDTLFVIVGSFGTHARQTQARKALDDVCAQVGRKIVLCVWEASSAWGLQVADYALWAVHRNLLGRPCPWYGTAVEPTLRSVFTPWGKAPRA
jgi:hypothetical protein